MVGGGAGGVELALAVRHRLDAEGRAAGLPAGRRALVACALFAWGWDCQLHCAGLPALLLCDWSCLCAVSCHDVLSSGRLMAQARVLATTHLCWRLALSLRCACPARLQVTSRQAGAVQDAEQLTMPQAVLQGQDPDVACPVREAQVPAPSAGM